MLVPLAGLEPALCCQKRILNPSRLPIPPQRPLIGMPLLPEDRWPVNLAVTAQAQDLWI